MNSNPESEKSIPTPVTNSPINPQKPQVMFPSIPPVTYARITETSPSTTSWSGPLPQNFNQKMFAERPNFEPPKINIPISQQIKSGIRQDFESPQQNLYPYLHSLNPSNVHHFNPLQIHPSQHQYRLLQTRLPYNRTYMNGCGSGGFPQSPHTLPLVERVKLGSNNQLPQMNKISNPISENNYSGFLDRSSDRNSGSVHSQNMSIVTGIKRNASQNDMDSISNNIKAVDGEPAPKKKKNYHPSREAIQKALSMGFVREVIKVQGENGEAKRSVSYTAPDGTVLAKKPDIKNYLINHPELGLKNENFSFDTRFSLNPKKRESFPKMMEPILESISTLPITSPTKAKPKAKKPEESNHVSPVKTPQKKMNPKNRKIISKYFKKFTEDTKYFDGLSPGSYRKKIPAFPKINISFPTNLSFDDACNIFQDVLTIFEFIKNFSSKLNIETSFTTLGDVASSLYVSDLEKSKFFKLFREILSIALSVDNFSNEVNTHFHMDNIQSFEWNWLIVHEIFKLYLENKSKLFKTSLPLQESIYCKNIEDTLTSLSNQEYIYYFKPTLKAFSIRFIIDQITGSNTFSSILNDHVEIVAKSKRDKFHHETRIRQLKSKIGSSVPNGIKSPESGKISGDENGNEVQNENNTPQTLTNLTSEMSQLELERDKCRDEINKNMSMIRAFNLGNDRFDRDYVFVESHSAIFVEGISSQVGIAQNKFPFTSHIYEKIKYPESDSLDQLVYISDQFAEKIGIDIKEFKFEIFTKTILESAKGDLTNSIIKNDDMPPPYYDPKDPILNVLINCPKIIRSITEDDFDQIVDVFNKNLSKHSKSPLPQNEHGQGWWYISDQSVINELAKSLNQKGLKEQNLYRSLNRYNEFITYPSQNQSTPTSISVKVESSPQISNGEIIKNGNSIIISEIKQIAVKMDKYINKINGEITKSFEDMVIEHLKESDVNIKQVVRQMLEVFLEKTEKRFDRVWYNKWAESFDSCASMSSLYILFISLKIKLDPNSKICKVCQTVNDDLTVCECAICQFSAHESCLESPMRKNKKSKLVCSKCFGESAKKFNRVCKKCSVKSGKTISCSMCKENFHPRCVSIKSKNKNENYVCEICNPDKLENIEPRVYSPPNISFNDAPFKPHVETCQKILEILRRNKDSEPFLEPVDHAVPNYYQIIKNPMSFKNITNKIKLNRYKTVTQFYNDVIQIFENCFIFNEDKSKIGKCGTRLQKLFENEWKLICSSFE